MNHRRTRWASTLLYLALTVASLQAQSGPTPEANPVGPTNAAVDMSRVVSQLQTELKSTQEILEASQRRSELESRQAAQKLAEQLSRLESRLESRLDSQSGDKDQILRALETSSQNAIRLASMLVGVGLFAVCLMSFLQWRATVHLTQLAARALPQRPDLSGYPDAQPLPQMGASKETARLIESLERLEHRIDDFEHGVGHPAQAPKILPSQEAQEDVSTKEAANPPRNAPPHRLNAPTPTPLTVSGATTLDLLSKGEAFLQLGQAADALRLFEEALTTAPTHAEAWVKKGSALERLERVDDALACYNRAISIDSSFTLAYLYKGGICNRLERFDEALACYEQALRSHETAAAS